MYARPTCSSQWKCKGTSVRAWIRSISRVKANTCRTNSTSRINTIVVILSTYRSTVVDDGRINIYNIALTKLEIRRMYLTQWWFRLHHRQVSSITIQITITIMRSIDNDLQATNNNHYRNHHLHHYFHSEATTNCFTIMCGWISNWYCQSKSLQSYSYWFQVPPQSRNKRCQTIIQEYNPILESIYSSEYSLLHL